MKFKVNFDTQKNEIKLECIGVMIMYYEVKQIKYVYKIFFSNYSIL